MSLSDNRKVIKCRYNNEHKAACIVAKDYSALVSGDNYVWVTKSGIEIAVAAGKDIALRTSSVKKAFVRDMPFPLSMAMGPFSAMQQIPDIPMLPLLPTLQPQIQALAMQGAAVAASSMG